jgi:Domain of unknown function (DUF6933)
MIIHCTKKLAAKLPVVSTDLPAENSPLGSWHANLYTIDRRNCLLFCHDETRYTLFSPGLRKPDFAELDRWFKEAFTASLAYRGMADSQVRRAELALGRIEFDTRTNRSVLGSLNQMRFLLDGRVNEVEDVMLLNPLSVTRWLCHYPVSRGKAFWMADEAMQERVMAL